MSQDTQRITEDWLTSLGFEKYGQHMGLMISHDLEFVLVPDGSVFVGSLLQGEDHVLITTTVFLHRSDVLRLLAALEVVIDTREKGNQDR